MSIFNFFNTLFFSQVYYTNLWFYLVIPLPTVCEATSAITWSYSSDLDDLKNIKQYLFHFLH